MDYPNNGPGTPAGRRTGDGQTEESERIHRVREYAEDATENFNEMVNRAREMVVRYPVASVAGAVAAGWLFARLIARRR